MKRLLGQEVPDLVLKLTDGIAFDAPQLPSKQEVIDEAKKEGGDGLKDLLDGFRNAAADMNTRCNTAAPTASLILAIAAILKARLDAWPLLYAALLLLAGFAVFAAITGLSIAVPFNRVGLPPRAEDAPSELGAVRRKEAWARLASGTATLSLVLLGIAAAASHDW